MAAAPTLNERAHRLADYLAANAELMRVAVRAVGGARVIDCGIEAIGGLQAGLGLARVCLAGQAEVELTPGEVGGVPCPVVAVRSDHAVLACMASQYAGWQIQVGKYFAMGSGPMRSVYAHEALFEKLPRETPPVAVGVLETRKMPTDEVIAHLSEKLGLPAAKITLLVAPASSLAGNIQVVARSLETALHKMHELGFDLAQVVSGAGWAPLPPVATNELLAIGRTNDAILYGGRVVLWVRSDDARLEELGRQVPSSASSDYGAPFAEIFARHGNDFYKIDPLLFSPAEVVFHNLNSGHTYAFGHTNTEVLMKSFFRES